ILDAAIQDVPERPQFREPPDERRVHPPGQRLGSGTDFYQPVREYLIRDPLQPQRPDGHGFDGGRHRAVSLRPEEHLALPGVLLEPAGEVDGRPGGQYLRTGRLLRRHHFAGVDADPDADLEVPQMGHMLVQLGERGAHVDGREHGAQWIVLTYHWDPEHSHDGVSDELLDHATATDQAIVHQREVTRHQVVDYLG